MNSEKFKSSVFALYGYHWNKKLRELLASKGYSYTRQAVWNWSAGKHSVPDHVEEIVLGELKRAAEYNVLPVRIGERAYTIGELIEKWS